MENVRITYGSIINAVTGVIYEMHPYRKPENIDKIVDTLNNWYENTPDSSGRIDATFKIFEWNSWNDFEKWLKEFLMKIPEFRQLNVSRALKDQGVVDCDDKRNSGFSFTSRYDADTKDKRYTDFIDLDACIRNIVGQIDKTQQMDEDCFLCKYAKEYHSMEPSDCDKCKACICNPNIRYNRETHPMALKPLNQWTEEEKQKYRMLE